jgi:FkbM family methyltransferase
LVGHNKLRYYKKINHKIHCFEPIISLYENLIVKYKKNNNNIKINNFGILNLNGVTHFNELSSLETDGCSSIIERPVFKELGWAYKQYEIEVKTIDQYCIDSNIDYIDIIKIDVEGAEVLVFKGMESLLSNSKIGLVQFEYGNTFDDANFSLWEIFKLTKEFNYTLCYFLNNNFIKIDETNIQDIIKINNINLIFKKND